MVVDVRLPKETQPDGLLLADDDVLYLSTARRVLRAAGYQDVRVASTLKEAGRLIEEREPRLFMVDIHMGGARDGLDFLAQARGHGLGCLAVVVSADRSVGELFRGAMAGADDFFLKGQHLDLPLETRRILEEERECATGRWRPEAVTRLGYFRTMGLKPTEIEMLAAYAVGFPRYRELADSVQKAEAQVRKVFSRICEQLEIENMAQLTHVLTVCAMYRRATGERIASRVSRRSTRP